MPRDTRSSMTGRPCRAHNGPRRQRDRRSERERSRNRRPAGRSPIAHRPALRQPPPRPRERPQGQGSVECVQGYIQGCAQGCVRACAALHCLATCPRRAAKRPLRRNATRILAFRREFVQRSASQHTVFAGRNAFTCGNVWRVSGPAPGNLSRCRCRRAGSERPAFFHRPGGRRSAHARG